METVRFLLDENSLGLAEAVERHNLLSDIRIDLISVGDDDSIPRQSEYDAILAWAEEHGRILITRDR